MSDKVDRLENEIQSANEVKVATPHTHAHARHLELRMCSCLNRHASPGIRGEADPVPQGNPSETNQQPEGRAGPEGEGHHRAAGVIKKNNFTHWFCANLADVQLDGVTPFFAQREPEDRSGAGETEGGAREAEGGGPGEEPPAARAHVTCRRATLSPRAATSSASDCVFSAAVGRVQQDKREQARQDLKGLEETVVSRRHVQQRVDYW